MGSVGAGTLVLLGYSEFWSGNCGMIGHTSVGVGIVVVCMIGYNGVSGRDCIPNFLGVGTVVFFFFEGGVGLMYDLTMALRVGTAVLTGYSSIGGGMYCPN